MELAQVESTARALKQDAPPLAGKIDERVNGGLTHEEVDTPEALVAALQGGVAHVVVINHLDLTRLSPVASGTAPSTPGTILLTERTKSIRGNCSNDVPSEGELKYPRTSSRQCVLRSTSSFIEVLTLNDPTLEPNRLWLDNLYITATSPAAREELPVAPQTMITVSEGSQVWMTNIALIGGAQNAATGEQQPAAFSRGVHLVEGASAHMRNIAFALFEWDGAAAVRLDVNSSCAVTDASFSDCTGTSVIAIGPPSVQATNGTAVSTPAPTSDHVSGNSPSAAEAPDSKVSDMPSPGPTDADGTSDVSQGAPNDEKGGQKGETPVQGGPTGPEGVSSGPETTNTGVDDDRSRTPRNPRPPRELRGSQLSASATSQRRRLFDSIAAAPSSRMWLKDVQFSRNDIQAPGASSGDSFPAGQGQVPQIRSTGTSSATIYSNQAHLYFDEGNGAAVAATPLSEQAFVDGGFLSEDTPWFQSTQTEAVDVTGVQVLMSTDGDRTPLTGPEADVPSFAPPVHTRNTRGLRTRSVWLSCAVIAAVVVAVVAMVMIWRWSRSIRRRWKPPSKKKTFRGPLMPQSSARMPKLLKHMSYSTNNSMVAAGSPMVARNSFNNHHPIFAEDGGSVSPMAFPASMVQKNGSFSSKGESQPTGEANISVPPLPQTLRSMLSGSTLTPFNGSPQYRSQTSRSNFPFSQNDNASLRAMTGPGATIAVPNIAFQSCGSPTSGVSVAETVVEHSGSSEESMKRSEAAISEGFKTAESFPVEIRPSTWTKPWTKRHLFSDVSIMRASRRGTYAAHNAVAHQLEDTLTQMCQAEDPLLDMYQVCPPAQRKLGYCSQSMAQTVHRIEDGAEFVAKFYLDRELFDREENLRENPKFSSLLPPVRQREANDDSHIRAANGFVLPPFVIMSCGVSLKEWCDTEPRTYAARVKALCVLATELCSLHEAGLVHRGLHPNNVLWLPMHARWILADFGHAVQIGRSAPLHVNRPYTPPEATLAEERVRTDMIAEAAADIWALGVTAHEVLTGTPNVAPAAVRDEVNRRAQASQEEDPLGLDAACAVVSGAAASCDNHQLLGPLAPTVYSCLSSEPSARPTARAVMSAWQSVLTQMHA